MLSFWSIVSSVYSLSLQTITKRGAVTVLTAQRASESVCNGHFMSENNLWGESYATSGFQNSQVTSTSGNTVTWQTSYNWVGGQYRVKSYANLDLKVGLGKPLGNIASIPTVWNWEYENASANLTANVSFDMWLGNSATATGSSSTTTFEVMIWLSSRGGATPYGSVVGPVMFVDSAFLLAIYGGCNARNSVLLCF